MSESGASARGKIVDLLCVQCEEAFGMPAEIFLDGGASECPHCGWLYRLDGTAGEALDQIVTRFRESLRRVTDDYSI